MLIEEVRRCFEAEGPFATAYLETPSDDPQAAATAAVRWKTIRQSLAAEGAGDDLLNAMDDAVGVDSEAVETGPKGARENSPRSVEVDDQADHGGGDVLGLVAAGGEVLVRRFLPDVPVGGRWRLAPLPWVTPLLEAGQRLVPHLVVLLDRRGADIWGVDERGDEVVQGEVQGQTFGIRRTAQGGWSQRRIQQRAVNAWEANAKEVADEVAAVAADMRARLVLVAGDAHSVSFFHDAVPAPLAPIVRQLDSGARGPESGLAGVSDEVERLVRTVAAEETVAELRAFGEEQGSGRAADGPRPVVEALQMGLVGTLLVADDPDDERSAWFGPQPLHLGLDREDLVAMGVERPREGRLVDVCLRAAFGGDADVRVVPGSTLTGGLGARLRAPSSR